MGSDLGRVTSVIRILGQAVHWTVYGCMFRPLGGAGTATGITKFIQHDEDHQSHLLFRLSVSLLIIAPPRH